MVSLKSILLAGDPASAGTAARPERAPVITCEAPVYDFGSIENETTLRHAFVIKNTGNGPLEIQQVIVCCGASAELDHYTVLPGSETMLTIRMSLRGRTGKQTKRFYVRTNDPRNPMFAVGFDGVVISKVDVEPSGAMLTPAGEYSVAQQDIAITCQPNIILHVTNVTSTLPHVAATYDGCTGTVHRLRIRTVPPLPTGLTRGVVRVMTDHAEFNVLEIPVVVKVSRGIAAVPDEIVLPLERGISKRVSRFMVVRSLDQVPFRILDIVKPVEGMEIVCSQMTDGGYKIEVRNLLPDESMNGKCLILKTDNARWQEVVVPIRVIRVTTKS